MENNNEKHEKLTAEELKNKAVEDLLYFFETEQNKSNPRMAPSMIVNAYWDLSKTSEKIKKKIIDDHEKYSKIYADVVSSLDNPNCSCRGRFAGFILENKDEAIETYKGIIYSLTDEESENLKTVIEKQHTMFLHFKIDLEKNKKNDSTDSVNNAVNVLEADNKNELNDDIRNNENFSYYLEGNVIEIEDTAEAYGNLIKNLRHGGEFYKGINIIQKPNNKMWVYLY